MIVTYNCSSELAQNVSLLAPQVERLLIVDNGSRNESLQVIQNIQKEHGCEVVYNHANLGVAAALNIGVEYAKRNRFEWLATFDQDSQVADDFIGSLLKTYKLHPSAKNVGMILPRYKDRASGIEVDTMCSRSGPLLIGITSGALTRVTVFDKCGLFEERLFIDCVDTEFCLRINWMGWRVIESKGAVLLHSLGRTETWELGLGRRVSTTNHNASRRYYIARNRMLLWSRYLWKYPRWTIDDIGRMIRELGAIIIMERDKGKKVAFTLRGFLDAATGRFGLRMPL